MQPKPMFSPDSPRTGPCSSLAIRDHYRTIVAQRMWRFDSYACPGPTLRTYSPVLVSYSRAGLSCCVTTCFTGRNTWFCGWLHYLPVLFTTAAPWITARDPPTKAGKESNINRDAVDHLLELLYHLSFPIFYGGWSFVIFPYSASFESMAHGFDGAALAALLYLSCHLYFFSSMDETIRDGFWIDVEWVFFRRVVFLGLVVGTYANGNLPLPLLDFRSTMSPAMLFIFQALQALLSAHGLTVSSAFLQRIKYDYTTNGAILNAMRNDPKVFIMACAFTVIWVICDLGLLSVMWSSISARRIFGSAFVAMFTGMISWPPTQNLEGLTRNTKKNTALHRGSSYRGDGSSRQFIFAVHWATVVVAVVVSLTIVGAASRGSERSPSIQEMNSGLT